MLIRLHGNIEMESEREERESGIVQCVQDGSIVDEARPVGIKCIAGKFVIAFSDCDIPKGSCRIYLWLSAAIIVSHLIILSEIFNIINCRGNGIENGKAKTENDNNQATMAGTNIGKRMKQTKENTKRIGKWKMESAKEKNMTSQLSRRQSLNVAFTVAILAIDKITCNFPINVYSNYILDRYLQLLACSAAVRQVGCFDFSIVGHSLGWVGFVGFVGSQRFESALVPFHLDDAE